MEEGQRAIQAMKGARVGQWPINVGWIAAQQVHVLLVLQLPQMHTVLSATSMDAAHVTTVQGCSAGLVLRKAGHQLVLCRVQGADAEAEVARLMVDRADPTNTYVYAGNLPQQARPIPHGPVLLCW